MPSIEELVQPHLDRLRREAEAKRGDKVGAVQIWFKDTVVLGSRYTVHIAYGDRGASWIGFGSTVDEAIRNGVDDIKPVPNLSAILGYEESVG